MRGLALILALSMAAPVLGACSPTMERMPESSWQWERRQEQIERREAERRRLCAIMDKETDRYERDCQRPGDPD